MPGKRRLHFRDKARAKILAGASALADAVRATLGPKSKCMLLERKWGAPLVCNDGVTIAKEIELEDPVENLGVRVLREAASRTSDAVGDGTTTSTLIAHAIFSEGLRNVAAGASAIDLKRGLDRGLPVIRDALRRASRPVSGRRERVQVAAISAHNDTTIGELVADAIDRVGADGAVTVEEAKGTETALEVVEGLQFDHGYLSPYFVTQSDRLEAVLSDALVLLADKRIASAADLLPLLEHAAKTGRPLLIIAEDIESDALATLVINKIRGTLACAAVKSPGFGDRRRAMLEDMAVLTGGRVIADELGVKLPNVGPEQLGSCKRVVVTRETTTLIGGGGDRAAIQARIADLKRELASTKSDYDREKLEQRLAKLSGGVAVIHVGAPSETEMRNKKEAFEDAISATRAAVAEGIVAGGGLALIRAVPDLVRLESECDGDVRTGVRILKKAVEMPAFQIAVNSGFDGGVVVDRLRGSSGVIGFDAACGEYVDLFEAGIIDPTKVVRIAVENAVSVASTLLLAEGTVTEVEDDKKETSAVVLE